MVEVDIKFVKTHKLAKLPTRGHDNIPLTEEYINTLKPLTPYLDEPITEVFGTHDTGYDIYCVEETKVPARGSAVVPTGIKVGFITPGYWFKIEARSGLGFKKGLEPHPGIVDNQYRGDLGVKLFNLTDEDYTFSVGERIAQIVVYDLIDTKISWIDKVNDTARGEKGFGSTGTH